MKRLVHALESSVIDVCVDLRRRDTGMAQQFLHLPQVSSACEQMRRKAVPQ